MKHTSKITLFFSITVVLIFGSGCANSGSGIGSWFATDTYTPTPTQTPLPTATPKPPVLMAQCTENANCPDAVSIFDLVEGSIDFDAINYIDLPVNQSVWVNDIWNAIDNETMTENLPNILWFFQIDGQDFFQTSWLKPGEFEYYSEPDGALFPGYQWGVVLDNWKVGEAHQIEFGYVIDKAISNGWYDFDEGYTFVASFIVNPVELPTPTPTETATPSPTATATKIPYTSTPRPTATPACNAVSSIEIDNTTGGALTLKLNGPASYSFNLGTGITNLSVCPGSYTYDAWGCGGASDSGSINSGESHEFYCTSY